MTAFTIRTETHADHGAVRRVHRLAFGQDYEADVVDGLRSGGYARLSLVADVSGTVAGHILFSELRIVTESGDVPAVALAPLAVRPQFQNQGIGSELVRHGLQISREHGHRIVIVRGHPHFYPRFGFSAQLTAALSSPFAGLPSWMALELTPGSLDGVSGRVQYPPPFGPPPDS